MTPGVCWGNRVDEIPLARRGNVREELHWGRGDFGHAEVRLHVRLLLSPKERDAGLLTGALRSNKQKRVARVTGVQILLLEGKALL